MRPTFHSSSSLYKHQTYFSNFFSPAEHIHMYIEKRVLYCIWYIRLIRDTSSNNNHHIIHSTQMNGNRPHFFNKKKSRVLSSFFSLSAAFTVCTIATVEKCLKQNTLIHCMNQSATHEKKIVSHVFTKKHIYEL